MLDAERVLQDFLASKSLSDLVCEFENKAPKKFIQETGAWFQARKTLRVPQKRLKA